MCSVVVRGATLPDCGKQAPAMAALEDEDPPMLVKIPGLFQDQEDE